MMASALLIAYIVIFVLQLVLLVVSIRKKRKKFWLCLFLTELIPMLITLGLAVYYDRLPGYGIMPGLSYIGEVLFSFGAALVYGVVFLISVFSWIVSANVFDRTKS